MDIENLYIDQNLCLASNTNEAPVLFIVLNSICYLCGEFIRESGLGYLGSDRLEKSFNIAASKI